MANIITDNKHYTDIANAIRDKAQTTDTYKPEEMAEAISAVYSAGKQANYDEFWDAYQTNGTRYNYNCAFAYWADICYNPKYPMKPTYNSTMFSQSSIIDTKQPIDFTNAGSLNSLFISCTALTTVRELTVKETHTFNDAFTNCRALTNITFAGTIGKNISFADCNLLTVESIANIIAHLKDLTGATAQTLTLHADAKARLTDDMRATISAKNWILG